MQCIFPLQPIKGNMQRVYIAMESIAREVRVRVTCGGCIVEGVHEALEQFHRVTQNSKQVSASSTLCCIQCIVGHYP